jgi:hypothetical protein
MTHLKLLTWKVNNIYSWKAKSYWLASINSLQFQVFVGANFTMYWQSVFFSLCWYLTKTANHAKPFRWRW